VVRRPPAPLRGRDPVRVCDTPWPRGGAGEVRDGGAPEPAGQHHLDVLATRWRGVKTDARELAKLRNDAGDAVGIMRGGPQPDVPNPWASNSSEPAAGDGEGLPGVTALQDHQPPPAGMTTRQKRARRQSILYRFRGRICCEFREQAPGTPNPKPYTFPHTGFAAGTVSSSRSSGVVVFGMLLLRGACRPVSELS
jgi:hypothetical protein